MSATHAIDSTTASGPTLYAAFELGWNSSKLALPSAPIRSLGSAPSRLVAWSGSAWRSRRPRTGSASGMDRHCRRDCGSACYANSTGVRLRLARSAS